MCDSRKTPDRPILLTRKLKRRVDFKKIALHHRGRGDAEHLLEGPGDVRGISKVRSMRGGRDGAFTRDGERGPGELAPEHVTPERQANLLLEQVCESARR